MIHREDGEIVLECDDCGAEECGGTLEWNDFWRGAKADGWHARKDGDAWEHTCPECSEGV